MKRLRIIFFTVTYGFVCHLFIFQPAVYAQENLEVSVDCTDVRVDYTDDRTLTREERIRLMDNAYYKSLNQFELCQSAKKMAETSDGGTAAASTNGVNSSSDSSGDSSGKIEGASAGGSVASSTMSGTELSKVSSATENNSKVEESDVISGSQSENSENSTNKRIISATNGKLPEDIPSADNDGALAAQIRYAAENETDPVKKAQLWNEYRKYKGLPQK